MDCEAINTRILLERMLLDSTIKPTKLPLTLLQAITNNFSDDQKIGSGGFAAVYKGLLENGTVAVKRLWKIEVDEKKFIQEIDSLMRVNHENIVRFLGYCAVTEGEVWNYEGKLVLAEERRQRLLCFEFLSKGSLDEYISDASGGLEWRTRYQIIKGICEGLNYLHNNEKIVHSDLKPANILLDHNMNPKIADFGLSRCFDEKQTRAVTSHLIGTLGYMAPELYDGQITFKSDIYSLGIIIIEILTGRKGYPEIENVLEQWSTRFQTSQQGGTLLEHVRVCAEIGLQCMDSDPVKRPNIRNIINMLGEWEHTYVLTETDLSATSKWRPLIKSADQDKMAELKVKMMSRHPPDVVYTIGDEVSSFTRFIMDLRGFLAEHPDKEDILGRPVLAKQRAEQPARWLHVKLQVVEGKKTYSTTLLVRDDNLYVHGFTNQHGVSYEILDNAESENMLPNNPQRLYWGLSYNTILGVQDGSEATAKLAAEGLGKSFAANAVRRLSSSIHPDDQVAGMMSARVALAGLIVMVYESARMSPLHDAIAGGWSNDTVVFTEQLMDNYVRKYGVMSRELQAWKRRDFTWPHGIAELQAIYLVLNTRLPETTTDDGRPRVELLSIRADLQVIGTKIIIFDGKRGQIIYMHKEQGEQGTTDLVLTGPSTAISAYGCFAIKIDIPATDPVKWEWDGYDPTYAAQVDKPPVSQKIGSIAEVTYAVVSNARVATVQVKLRLNDGLSPGSIQGKITALIDDFGVSKVLFNNTQGMDLCFSPTDDSWFLLQLDRSEVTVPCGKELHIKVDLEIGTSNDQAMKHFKANFSIANGILSQCHVADGGEVEVSIIWYPPPPPVPKESILRLPYVRELGYTIGDDGMSYTGFIMALRRILADHPDREGEDILDGLSSTRQHPVLTRLKNEMYFRIRLQVAGTEEFTVLSIDMHDLRVLGFENLEHRSYSPEGWRIHGVHLENQEWARRYDDSILSIPMDKSERMGKNFAVNAVHVLSRFRKSTQHKPEVEGSSGKAGGDDEEYRAKRALAGLKVMVCDSARINPVHEAIAAGWNDGTTLTEELMAYAENWERISSALRDWKDTGYCTWKEDERLERMGIKNPEDALDVVRLCSNKRMYRF